MWYIFLTLVVVSALGLYFNCRGGKTAAVVMAGASLMLLVWSSPVVLGLTTGFVWNDVPRQLTGYVVAVDEENIVATTTELTLDVAAMQWQDVEQQLETGSDAASFFRLSTVDPDIRVQLKGLIGQKINVTYKPWVIQPFRQGLTSFEILNISQITTE